MIYVHFALFLVSQVALGLFLKWGSGAPERWWWGFLGCNAFGMTSSIFYMAVFRLLPPNMAVAYCAGGAFLMIQFALWMVYREPLAAGQWLDIALITCGIGLFGWTQAPVSALSVDPP